MNADTESLILEHLRAIRSSQDDHSASLRELTDRAGRLERLTADLHTDFASISVRMDRLTSRVERIEQRLELEPA